MPSQMLAELQTGFGERGFDFIATRFFDGQRTVFEILLRLHPDYKKHVLPRSIFDQPYRSSVGRVTIWRLTCCRNVLKYDTKVWAETLGEKDGATLFGNTSLPEALGDGITRLLWDL